MSQPSDPASDDSIVTEIVIDESAEFKVYMTEDETGEHPAYKLHIEDAAGNPLKAVSPAPEYCAFLSKARLLHAGQPPYLRRNYQKLLTQMIGEAVALAIRDELAQTDSLQDKAGETKAAGARDGSLQNTAPEEAKKDHSLEKQPAEGQDAPWENVYRKEAEIAFARALAFMNDRAIEATRMSYVSQIAMVLIVLYLPFVAFSLGTDFIGQASDSLFVVKLYALAFVGGALGAGFSLLIRVGTIEFDPQVDKRAHYEEVIFRVAVGALAALIIVIGLQANVFGGFTDVSSPDGKITKPLYERTFWLLLISSIAAGFSEKAVPSLLEQFGKKTVNSDAEKQRASKATSSDASVKPEIQSQGPSGPRSSESG